MESRSVATRTIIQAAVVAGVAVLAGLVLYAAEVFLVIFAGILIAILFCRLGDWIQKLTGLKHKWTIGLAILTPFLLLGAFIWLVAPSVSEQASELQERIPAAVKEIKSKVQEYSWGQRLLSEQDRLQEALPSDSKAASLAGSFASTTFGALGNLVFALAVGIFLAITPSTYVNGLVHLVPLNKRERTKEVLGKTSDTLASWLTAKLIEMLAIGIMTTIGLWLIGIDLALVLGLIAAVLSFIPNFGPIISLVPALLIAMVGELNLVIYVIGLYAAVQTIESYLLTPLLQKHMVDLQPALTISVQVLFGFLFGVLGLILSVPLTAAVMVMTQMWYVEDMLGDDSFNKS